MAAFIVTFVTSVISKCLAALTLKLAGYFAKHVQARGGGKNFEAASN